MFTGAVCHFAERTGIFFRTFKVKRVFIQLATCAVSVTATHPFNLRASFPPIFEVPQTTDLSFQPLSVVIMHQTLEIERHFSFFEGIVDFR